jgi:branched-chain amino acid transport system substrate-binding protein
MKCARAAPAVLATAALSAVSLACGSGRPADRAATPALPVLRVATQSPLRGDRAALGVAIRDGVTLAVEQRAEEMAALGFRLQVVAFDDRSRPDIGRANAGEIAADPDVLLVIGHLTSTVTLPASEIYQRAGLAMISPASSDPRLTDRGFESISRVIGRDDGQGAAGAVFAAEDLRARQVFIVHDGSPAALAVAAAFRLQARRRGLQVAGEALLGQDVVAAAREAGAADLIYLSLPFSSAGAVIREVRKQGGKAEFLGPDWLHSPEILRLAGRAAVGAHYTAVAGPPSFYEGTADFVKAYRRRFAVEPPSFAPSAYDAARLGLDALVRSIGKAGGRPSRRQVATAVRGVHPFRGLTGTFVLDGRGDPDPAPYFLLRITGTNPLEWSRRPVRLLRLPPPAR